MNAVTLTRIFKLLVVLVVAAALAVAWSARSQPQAPPVEAQTISYSIAPGSPLHTLGAHPADIMGIGDVPLIPCQNLGLLCTDPVSGAEDNLSGLSFGADFMASAPPMLLISPAPGATGSPGSAVRLESQCQPAEPQADVFEAPLSDTNMQYLDGNGTPCSTNTGYSLYLQETPTSDNLDALDGDPCQSVDLNCDGFPEEPVFLTLSSGSPSLAYFNISPADILWTTGYTPPTLWASGVNDLGLQPGDAIDALCIQENGDAVFDSQDKLLFSLAPGSPSLTSLAASPGFLLRPSPRWAKIHASTLGLAAGDDLDAAYCARFLDIYDSMLPLIRR